MRTLTRLLGVLVLAIAALAGAAPGRAQPGADAIPGTRFSAFVPARLGRLPRTGFNEYSVFVTAEYRGSERDIVILQIHSVVGSGAAGYTRDSCPRFARIADFDACVRPRDGRVSLTWVLEDRVLVTLGAVDEATATRLARLLDLRGLERLAREH